MFSITSESGRLGSAPLPRAALRSGGADDDDDDESVYSVSVQKTTFSDDRSHFECQAAIEERNEEQEAKYVTNNFHLFPGFGSSSGRIVANRQEH